ncbi:MAG: DUF1653 domain-containing protein [Patescibacteria group bacterium]
MGKNKLGSLRKRPKVLQGKYQHYKGKKYKVLGIASHSETLEKLVVYQTLYGKKKLWLRPKKMFLQKVKFGGKKIPRFKYLRK